MIQIFNKYSIPYLDMFNEGGLNSYNDIHNTRYFTGGATGLPDKTHPNENAYKKYYVPKLIDMFENLICTEEIDDNIVATISGAFEDKWYYQPAGEVNSSDVDIRVNSNV
jgi:hypothetical protein